MRKTLVVSLLPLICSFSSQKQWKKYLWGWILRKSGEIDATTQQRPFEEWPKKNRSWKAISTPPVSLRQTWHKSLEWLLENKMNHAAKMKWTTTKSIIYLIKELAHTIWRSLAPGPAGKHFNSHCGDAFIKITTTNPGLPELICYKQS